MSHFPKPFFKKSRGLWYVEINRKQINLGPDRDEAQRRYHQLMVQPRQKPVASTSVVAIVDSFLEWVEKHRSPETYEWYRYRLQKFCERYPDLRTSDLRPFHVQEWVDSCEQSRTSKRNYMRSVKRCLKWAVQQGYVDANPIEHLEVPGADRRDGILTLADYERLLKSIRSEPLRDLVVTTWTTGCRPQESLRVEARHVDVARQRWVFPKSESKGKRNPRVVYLTGEAWEIVSRRIRQFPTGRLFRNSEGAPWTTDAVNCALERVRVRIYVAGEGFSAELVKVEMAELLPQLRRTRTLDGQVIERPAEQLRGEARLNGISRTLPPFSQNRKQRWPPRSIRSPCWSLATAPTRTAV